MVGYTRHTWTNIYSVQRHGRWALYAFILNGNMLYIQKYDKYCYLLFVFNTLRPRKDGRHFAHNILTCIFFNRNCCILIKFSLKYVCKGPIDNNPSLVQIMAWRRSGDKPLSEPMMISLPSHICVTRPQWVKQNYFHLTGPKSLNIDFIYSSIHAQSCEKSFSYMCCLPSKHRSANNGRQYTVLSCV